MYQNKSLIRLSLLLSFIMLVVAPTLAQRPEMDVIATWTPEDQLTSLVGDDRYVELQLFAQGNVQFWAVEISCSVGRGDELTPVDPESLTTDLDGYIEMGPEWGEFSVDHFAQIDEYDNRGTMTFVVSRLGTDSTPIGVNGVDRTTLLATATFKVNTLDRDSRVAANCRTLEFLDRNGDRLVRGRSVRTGDLNIFVGYTLEGTVLRQGARDHSDIDVTCTYTDSDPDKVYTTQTDRRGEFQFDEDADDSSQPLRDMGQYDCLFSGTVDPTRNEFIDVKSIINLTMPEYSLLPVVVRPGDFDGDDEIDLSDIGNLTANYGMTGDAFDDGDANGDRRVDSADLAIVAGNLGLSDVTPEVVGHLVYGLARDLDAGETFPNSKIWWGTSENGGVTELVSRSRTRDFWPQLSPNGMEVAYSSIDARTGQYHIYIADTSNGRGSQFTPRRNFDWDAMAPSWSPDGSRVAFVCSFQDSISGYEFNEGYLCMMNRDDRGGDTFTVLNVNNQRLDTKIFPPAWLNNNVLIYAGTKNSDSECADTLCFYDIENNVTGELRGASQRLATGSDRADMPYIIEYDGTTYLSYRFYDSGTPEHKLGMATIEYDFDGNPATFDFDGGVDTTPGSGTHEYVSGSSGVDYYAVSPALDILFYEFNETNFQRLEYSGTLGGDWSSAGDFYVDGVVGGPVTSSLFGSSTGTLWDGDDDNSTLLHAQRMTFDWTP